MDLGHLRKDYPPEKPLRKADVETDPLQQFQRWFKEAEERDILEPNAMILGTSSVHGRPSTRTLLLKGYDERGFVFYTNYGSRKGQDLDSNPFASMTFLWLPMARQITVMGAVERVTAEESSAYYNQRPRGSQLGAWASEQDRIVESYKVIWDGFAEQLEHFEGKEIPRPDNWGGYRLRPDSYEFWQGRPNRLHDRIIYRLDSKAWIIERRMP